MKIYLFDLDGVLIHDSHSFPVVLQEKYGINKDVWADFFEKDFFSCVSGKKDTYDVIKEYIKMHNISITADEVMTLWLSIDIHLHKDFISFIREVRKIGAKCCIVSNQEKYRALSIDNILSTSTLFDKVYYSYKIGFIKPEIDFFQNVYNDILESFGDIQKDDIIYFDDCEFNVLSGINFGFTSLLFKSKSLYKIHVGLENKIRFEKIYNQHQEIEDSLYDVINSICHVNTDVSVHKNLGEALNPHDVLLVIKAERDAVIPMLSNTYGIDFLDVIEPIPFVYSPTSLKCILHDTQGNKYVLKQKPDYSLMGKNLSGIFQYKLSNATNLTPEFILTKDGDMYVNIGGRISFLTRYIEGTFYHGKLIQSQESAIALAKIHNASKNMGDLGAIDSEEDMLAFFFTLVLEKFDSIEIINLVNTCKAIWEKSTYTSKYRHEKMIIHRDFAPFNIVYNRNFTHEVIAVNDFDNVCYSYSIIDLAEMIVTHCMINYAGATSSMTEPIITNIDVTRAGILMRYYINTRHSYDCRELDALPYYALGIRIELMLVGILRGDFSILSVHQNLYFTSKIISTMKVLVIQEQFLSLDDDVMYHKFYATWSESLYTNLGSTYTASITKYLEDNEFGLKHSYYVYKKSIELTTAILQHKSIDINIDIIEYIAVFHDIGKFFEEIHSLENISIAGSVFIEYAQNAMLDEKTIELVLDGIKGSDFYNSRLDPSGKAPISLEGEIARCADKMQDNIIDKVDRYRYKYGVPRGATFYDPSISFEDRKLFSFDNFLGDQLNVVLSIIGLHPTDFNHMVLVDKYRDWSSEKKDRVVAKILALAQDIGYQTEDTKNISLIIEQYRKEYDL